MSELKVYHGSYREVDKPSLDNGRMDADFGIGFYVTTDLTMAEKWASRKKKAIINEYVNELREINKADRKMANQLTSEIIRNRNKFQG